MGLDRPPRSDRLPAGEQIAGRFRVERLLGKGSMGAVYLCHDDQLGEVAVKVVSIAAMVDPRSAHRFEREARLTASLLAPGIVRTLASGRDTRLDALWMAMERVPGVGLDEWLRQSPDVDARTRVLVQLFEAVAFAHDAGVVHRDLKPENVLVVLEEGQAEQVKVLDFGIAKQMESATAALTMAGLGTPLWTAPEQAQTDELPTRAADVWALGLLTFYVLTGAHYWRSALGNASLFDLVQELLSGPLPPASERLEELGLDTALPAGFDVWFGQCVVRSPQLRFTDAREALDALRSILEPELRPPPRRTWRGWLRPLLWILALGGGTNGDCSYIR